MEIAYMAGLLDGEGWIRIGKQRIGPNHIRYQLFVGINMTDPRGIRPIYEQFGGCWHVHRHKQHNWRTLFGWIVASNKCTPFLTAVLPYLKVKREEALLALRFTKHIQACTRPGVKGYPPRVMQFRERCYQRMMALKHRTFHQST